MRKSIVIVAVVLFLIAAVIVVAVVPNRPGLPAGCQTALDKYISFKNDSLATNWRLVEADRAATPSQFTAALDYIAFGDSLYYQTDEDYGPQPAADAQATALWSVATKRPLPFPPEELWCARIEAQGDSQAAGDGIVFVALHQDIHQAEWAVHESLAGPFSADSLALATTLGCDIQAGH